jgi:hypothetical protein
MIVEEAASEEAQGKEDSTARMRKNRRRAMERDEIRDPGPVKARCLGGASRFAMVEGGRKEDVLIRGSPFLLR